MLPCALWLRGPVPSRAKERRAVNWASVNGDAVEPRGVRRGAGDLRVAGRGPVADTLVDAGGQVRRVVAADDRDAHVRRIQAAQVAAELQELGAPLAGLDVPEQSVAGQVAGGEQVPDAVVAVVGGAAARPQGERCGPTAFVLWVERIEAVGVEVVDHVPDPVRTGER